MKKLELACALALRDFGPQTVTELAQRCELSRPSVVQTLAQLEALGVVQQSETTVGGRDAGRPARVFAFNARAGFVVGVQIAPSHHKAIIVDLEGGLRSSLEQEVPDTIDAATRLAAVELLIDSALSESGLASENLLGMALAVSGMVSSKGELLISWNIPEWVGFDFSTSLGLRYGVPVQVENDARCALLAEQLEGAAQGHSSVVYLSVGHHLALSIMIKGELHVGKHHAAGEAGQLGFPELAAKGSVPWETAEASAAAFAAARSGNETSQRQITAMIDKLAPGVARLAMMIDPDVTVIGGELGNDGGYLPQLLEQVNSHISIPMQPELTNATLGAKGVALGAALLAMESAARIFFGHEGTTLPRLHNLQPQQTRAIHYKTTEEVTP